MKCYFEKKLCSTLFYRITCRYFQYIRFLALFLVMVVCCSFLVNKGLENVKVTLKLKDVTIKEVLTAIEKKCDYYFTYNSSHFDSHQKMTIMVNNTPLKTVLDKYFTNDTIQYKIIENHIVFYRVKARKAAGKDR